MPDAVIGVFAGRPAWRAQAACLGQPDVWWFPEPGGATGPGLMVCAGCSVRGDCLAYAIEHGEKFGT